MTGVLTGLLAGVFLVAIGCLIGTLTTRRRQHRTDPDTTPGPIDSNWLRLELTYRAPAAERRNP